MNSIGIIGVGFVGRAIYEGFKNVYNIWCYDKNSGAAWDSTPIWVTNIEDLLSKVDGPIFLCLPTPMNPDGSCNTDTIECIISQVNEQTHVNRTLIIKSTVPPGTTNRLNDKYRHVDVCFNPEFLTERSAVEDFRNQKFVIVGGPSEAVRFVKQVYQRGFPNVPFYKTEASTAEMVKYTINCYLATRVSFANEIKQICDSLDIDYDKVVEYATKDDRIGHTHWAVPGPDQHLGFGGSCFIKDLNSLMTVATNAGVDPKVMKGVWEKNLEVRPEKDWEKLKGRAVV
jgi:UDPglucose 6-dehydrogenase